MLWKFALIKLQIFLRPAVAPGSQIHYYARSSLKNKICFTFSPWCTKDSLWTPSLPPSMLTRSTCFWWLGIRRPLGTVPGLSLACGRIRDASTLSGRHLTVTQIESNCQAYEVEKKQGTQGVLCICKRRPILHTKIALLQFEKVPTGWDFCL